MRRAWCVTYNLHERGDVLSACTIAHLDPVINVKIPTSAKYPEHNIQQNGGTVFLILSTV